MLLERREKGEKRNMKKAVAGIDLSDAACQISYCLPGAGQPETLSQVAGEEQYMIPALLSRSVDRDLWMYGQQAKESAEKGEAILADRLLSRAAQKEPVVIGADTYDPVALLSFFFKKALTLLTPIVPPERLAALVFSVEEVTLPVIEALTGAMALLDRKPEQIYVIGRGESFFYYNISQPKELWRQEVLLCDFTARQLKTLVFCTNRRTQPVAAFVEEADWPEVERGIESEQLLDREFTRAMEAVLAGRQVTCIYLIGEGFQGEWYRESLPVLCRDRRVFLGNNLYSKGACYAARERLYGGISADFAFLGRDMLKANLGMRVTDRGKETYLALLDGGTNWYEASRELDFLLEEENCFSLRITPLDGSQIRELQVNLNGLPLRPSRCSRIHLRVDMTDVRTVRIGMEDLGFGEFFPATHRFWEESFEIA